MSLSPFHVLLQRFALCYAYSFNWIVTQGILLNKLYSNQFLDAIHYLTEK